MEKVDSIALRINEGKTGFEMRLNTVKGPRDFELSPEVAATLAIALVRLGAESGSASLAQVAQHFVVDDANFRLYNGSLVLLQELRGGLALYSSVDQEKLEALQQQIAQLLAGAKPPSIQ